jgi:histidinol dehydrogenase
MRCRLRTLTWGAMCARPAKLPVVDLRAEPTLVGEALRRPNAGVPGVSEAVRAIVADVRTRGDAALYELTKRFDGAQLAPPGPGLRAERVELAAAWEGIDVELQAALAEAAGRIRRYHKKVAATDVHTFAEAGVDVIDVDIPVGRAGLYVPGGRAVYPSTVLMTVIPAQAAGVAEIAVCVPPDSDGRLPAATAAAAHHLGVDEVYKVGGAQAIAALAYGTETIRPVDVVAGPGNAYVAAAKAEVARDVKVDSLAGPSECVVVADGTAPPRVVAVDLAAQAEHGPGGFTLLVTWSEELIGVVQNELAAVVAASPRQDDIRSTFADGARILLVAGPAQAAEVVNAAAPEHVQLMVADTETLLPRIRCAGAVFCGYNTPVTLGDYVAGPSHVLPTGGAARFASALRPADFRRSMHIVTASAEGLAALGPTAVTLADAEGLAAHADAVRIRLQ